MLLVLRPECPSHATSLLASLVDLGFIHVEIAWRPGSLWVQECRQLIDQFPALRLGAASLCSAAAVESAAAAGLGYGVSPILDADLIRLAERLGLLLVPGVFSPTEIHRARLLRCPIIKLFPASSLGPGYWRRLVSPLGDPLPFCIAAGGLQIDDVPSWLSAGVDAVAIGSTLMTSADPHRPGLDGSQSRRIRSLLSSLGSEIGA